MQITKKPLIVGAAIVAALVTTTLTACDVAQVVTGREPPPKVKEVVFVPPDLSRSTRTERRPGGLYERAIRRVLIASARRRSTVVFGRITGNSPAAAWAFETTFRTPPGIPDPRVAEAARLSTADRLMPRVRSLLREEGDGTDVLGAIQRTAQRAKTLPQGTHKVLVIPTDGALVVGRTDLYRRVPRTLQKRRRYVRDLQRRGELPRLGPDFEVYLVGVGLGVKERGTAQALIALWDELIRGTGAQLRANDADLAYPGRHVR